MRAFVLRMAPSGNDWVPDGLAADQITIGWARAAELADPALEYRAFREVLKRTYYPDHSTYQKAGAAAGVLWLFIREMSVGDLVVVPHTGQRFFVAVVRGPAVHEPDYVATDSAFRRSVTWLNDKKPIARRIARARLQSRMKIRQTCADATDLIAEIEEVITAADAERPPTFGVDLRERLIEQATAEMRSGRMDSFGFENLVATLLTSLGAAEVRVVGRSQDLGVDIIATFTVANTFPVRIGIQAKHFRPDPPVGPSVVDQLVAGMEAEGITMGWVATSGSFSPDAVSHKEELEEQRGISIELVDGDQLGAMLVEGGLRAAGLITAP
jgi:predicted Mrr-cat superfamily restriction endonuclease